jgi:hypothetical protein
MENSEQFYDEEIAPAVLAIAQKCEENGIPFLSVTEYAPGKFGETAVRTPDETLKLTMVRHCLKTAPNIDGYIIGLVKYLKEKGVDTSASIVCRTLESSDT